MTWQSTLLISFAGFVSLLAIEFFVTELCILLFVEIVQMIVNTGIENNKMLNVSLHTPTGMPTLLGQNWLSDG